MNGWTDRIVDATDHTVVTFVIVGVVVAVFILAALDRARHALEFIGAFNLIVAIIVVGDLIKVQIVGAPDRTVTHFSVCHLVTHISPGHEGRHVVAISSRHIHALYAPTSLTDRVCAGDFCFHLRAIPPQLKNTH